MGAGICSSHLPKPRTDNITSHLPISGPGGGCLLGGTLDQEKKSSCAFFLQLDIPRSFEVRSGDRDPRDDLWVDLAVTFGYNTSIENCFFVAVVVVLGGGEEGVRGGWGEGRGERDTTSTTEMPN